jgi:hypothetical protein
MVSDSSAGRAGTELSRASPREKTRQAAREPRCAEIARNTPEHEAGATGGIAVVPSERGLDPPHDRGNFRRQARPNRRD